MQTRLKVEKPDDVEFTMTITMKATEWENLRDTLATKWPASELSYRISDLLSQARKIFWAEARPDAS